MLIRREFEFLDRLMREYSMLPQHNLVRGYKDVLMANCKELYLSEGVARLGMARSNVFLSSLKVLVSGTINRCIYNGRVP